METAVVRALPVILSSLLLLAQGQAVSGGRTADDSLRYLVLGDWGGLPLYPFITPVEKSIGVLMGNVAANRNTQFVLALGDNFYFDGVSSVSDKRFQETFEAVFSAPSLQTKWYVIAGNHDHYGNAAAEIAYSATSTRWTFPDYNYTMTYAIPGTQSTVQFVMIDTVLLCGITHDKILGAQPPGPRDVQLAEDQWSWIEHTLNTSSANYLIVAGHYPVYSVGEHGPTEILVDRLQPLLYKYKVSAYLCGHDHNLQHLELSEGSWTVDYFVVGAAAFVENSTVHAGSVPNDSLKFFWADISQLGGFAYVEMNEFLMNVTFISGENNNLYQKSLRPRM